MKTNYKIGEHNATLAPSLTGNCFLSVDGKEIVYGSIQSARNAIYTLQERVANGETLEKALKDRRKIKSTVKKAHIGCYLPVSLIDELKQEAKERNMSTNAYIEMILLGDAVEEL